MYLTIHVNLPYYENITFRVNDYRIEHRSSIEYREAERIAQEIRSALCDARAAAREAGAAAATAPVAASAPTATRTCPLCGATTTPDASGRCEYCGGTVGA